MKIKIIIGVCAILALGILAVYMPALGARSQYGMPGIYNLSAINLSSGDGSALAVDSSGHLIMSTTSAVSVAFSSTATTTFPYNTQILKPTGTSTIQLGSSVINHGGCLVLSSGRANEFLYMFPLVGTGGIYLATSTNSADCY